MKYFFYGTLMDDEVLGAVIDRRLSSACRQAAVIQGYRRVYRAGAWYPILAPDSEGSVDGILVNGLKPADAVCLAAFERDEYGLAELPVIPARGGVTLANVFLPAPGVPASSEEWTFRSWRRKHRREYLRRTRGSCPRGPNWL